jgi:GDPmannose 4,6-dehydratase
VKKALITGISGQDGHHLTKLLASKGYDVHGIVRNQEASRCNSLRSLDENLTLHQGDLGDSSSLDRIIQSVGPDEIYNLGALSFVGESYTNPETTANITGLGAVRIFETVRNSSLKFKTRIYQASSSEMFGQARETPQTEITPFNPVSPYGVAKTFSHYSSKIYRESFGLHISCGILFNHEGEFRDHRFVTRKITSNVARLALGLQDRFSLGDLRPSRDWGYAGDYVEAMWLMLQQDKPDDYVIATGKQHTVSDFLESSLRSAGLMGEIEDYVDFDVNLMRPVEVNHLVGDASKAGEELEWSPKVDFNELVDLMVRNDIELESRA